MRYVVGGKRSFPNLEAAKAYAETLLPVIAGIEAKPAKKLRKSAEAIAAEALGLVRVRGALGGIYYE